MIGEVAIGTHRKIIRWQGGNGSPADDALVVEEVLQLQSGGENLAVIMRTPGHDFELLRGLLHAEGLMRLGDAPGRIELVESEQNRFTVELPEDVLRERWVQRDLISSSACGLCGASELAVLEHLATVVDADIQWTPEMVLAAPGKLSSQQSLFAQTGGCHGAALLDKEGSLLVCREDIGRHNAVDKVIGWALANPSTCALNDTVLVVSSRLSYEVVHKAVMAGIPMVIAVSAPSSLAVDLAERWRITLVGFTREQSFNVYSHPARISFAKL